MKLHLKLKNLNYILGLTIVIIQCLLMTGCKRGGDCVEKEKNFYFAIPDSTQKYILNRKAETLVFSNMKGDTISFYCNDSIHKNILLESKDLGLNYDCANVENTYSEYFEFNYLGDTTLFPQMTIKYILNQVWIPTYILTNMELNASDSIYDIGSIESLLNRTMTDSVLFFGKYYPGTYFPNKRVLFNRDLGVIKMIDIHNNNWQLIQKK